MLENKLRYLNNNYKVAYVELGNDKQFCGFK